MDSGQIRLGNKTIVMREHHDEDYVSLFCGLFCGLLCSLFCGFFKAIIIWLGIKRNGWRKGNNPRKRCKASKEMVRAFGSTMGKGERNQES